MPVETNNLKESGNGFNRKGLPTFNGVEIPIDQYHEGGKISDAKINSGQKVDPNRTQIQLVKDRNPNRTQIQLVKDEHRDPPNGNRTQIQSRAHN